MTRITTLLRAIALAGLTALAACGTSAVGPDGPPVASEAEVAQLASAIRGLSPDIDPAEAAHLADLAYAETHRLALAYEIVDPPLVHNTKVNMGLKPRGLCKDWADDLEARFRAEGYDTFSFHRAISNFDVAFRIDHSTVIVSARGDDWDEGIVLDPWRLGGALTWVPVTEDEEFRWLERSQVFDWKRERGTLVTRTVQAQ